MMKKYVEILEEIKKTSEAIAAADRKETELVESYMQFDNIRERHNARKAVENEMIQNSEHKKDLQITRKILKSNAKIALFNEVMPVALEILKKYNGKPYGEKTREKISEAVKNATGCRFYINARYSGESYNVYPVENNFNISCGTNYKDGNKKPLLISNKIQLVTFDEISIYYESRVYVADIPQHVAELKQLYKEAVAKQKELENICSKYNTLAVGDIKHIYKDKYIYENMDI